MAEACGNRTHDAKPLTHFVLPARDLYHAETNSLSSIVCKPSNLFRLMARLPRDGVYPQVRSATKSLNRIVYSEFVLFIYLQAGNFKFDADVRAGVGENGATHRYR
jgi:hypothetical protein